MAGQVNKEKIIRTERDILHQVVNARLPFLQEKTSENGMQRQEGYNAMQQNFQKQDSSVAASAITTTILNKQMALLSVEESFSWLTTHS